MGLLSEYLEPDTSVPTVLTNGIRHLLPFFRRLP